MKWRNQSKQTKLPCLLIWFSPLSAFAISLITYKPFRLYWMEPWHSVLPFSFVNLILEHSNIHPGEFYRQLELNKLNFFLFYYEYVYRYKGQKRQTSPWWGMGFEWDGKRPLTFGFQQKSWKRNVKPKGEDKILPPSNWMFSQDSGRLMTRFFCSMWHLLIGGRLKPICWSYLIILKCSHKCRTPRPFLDSTVC